VADRKSRTAADPGKSGRTTDDPCPWHGPADPPEPARDEFVGSDYQSRPDQRQGGIFAPEWVIRLTTERPDLLVLAQLAYWFGIGWNGKLRTRIRQDGFWWVAKSYRQLERETGLTTDQVRWALCRLRGAGVLVVSGRGSTG
jgi:hypothetical protein